MDDTHIVDRHADFVGHDLGQCGLEPLPVRGDTEHRRHLARGIEADRRRLGAGRDGHTGRDGNRRADPGQLDVGGDADAEPASLGARPGLLSAHGRVVQSLAGPQQRRGEARPVPHDAGRRLVGKFLVAHEIAETDLRRIQPELTRRSIHQALDHEDRRRASDSPIRAQRRLAGGDAPRAPTVRGHPVRPGQEADRLHRLDGGRPRIDGVRADVSGHLRPEPDDGAVAAHAELGFDDLVPRVRGREQILAAVTDPLHRATQAAGHHAGGDLLRVERRLGAEAAAHIGGDHTDAVLGHVEQIAQDVADETGTLRRRAQRERPASGPVLGQTAAVLHADRGVPVKAEPLAHDQRRPGQRLVHVAPAELAADE